MTEMLQDEVYIPPSTPTAGVRSASSSQKRLLIYYLPGNPGSVEYYHNFLQDLHDLLPDTIIYGATYDGFEFHDATISARTAPHEPPYSVDEVIQGAQRKLSAKAREFSRPVGDDGPIPVVLVGHSVGSYILLQILTWWQAHQEQHKVFTITGGVCLFPTVIEIAKSSKGQFFSKVLMIPFLPVIAHFAAMLLSCIPIWLWNWAKTLTPGEKIPSHVAVTEAVIRSRSGAKQAVFMAAHEMHDLAHDKWHPSNIWGVTSHSHSEGKDTSQLDFGLPRTKLFFYWGEDDYWVDNRIRDDFIAKRAKRENDASTEHWPQMVMDRHRTDHCFSLTAEHSKLVAEQVAEWIEGLKKSAGY